MAAVLYGRDPTIIMQAPVGRVAMAIVAVLATVCIVAADAAPTPVPITVIDGAGGLVDLGKAYVVAIHDIGNGTYAVISGYEGEHIVDVTHPADPLHVAAITYHSSGFVPGGLVEDIAVHDIGNGTYAFVTVQFTDICEFDCGGNSGYMHVIDITHPAGPTQVALVHTGHTAQDVTVRDIGNRTYAVVSVGSGMKIVDVTHPASPLLVTNTERTTPGLSDIAIHDISGRTYAFTVIHAGVHVMDITYPLDPLTVFDPPPVFYPGDSPGARSTAVHDIGNRTYAVVAVRDGVQIVDVTRPDNPLPMASVSDDAGGFTELGGAFDVAVHDIGNRTYAFVASRDDSGVQIIDITRPDNPAPVAALTDDAGGFTDLRQAADIAVHDIGNGTYAVVAGFHRGAQMINVTHLDPVSTTHIPAVTHIPVDARTAYLRIVGLGWEPDIATHDIDNRTYALVASRDDSGVHIIDITNPAEPLLMADAGAGLRIHGITTHDISNGTYALTVNYNGVQIIDITNPADPLPVAAVSDNTGGFTKLYGAVDIAVHDIGNRTYAVVASRGDFGVQIIDITHPADPLPVAAVSDHDGGFTELGGASGVAVHDVGNRTYALVASFHDSGVQIIDITNPADPLPAAAVSDDAGGFTELFGATAIATHDIGNRTYAVVASRSDSGVQIIDITNPADPLPVAAVSDDAGGFTKMRSPTSIAIHDIYDRTYAVVASSEGVQIIDITRPADLVPVAWLDGWHSVAIHEISDRTYTLAGYKNNAGAGMQIIDITDLEPASTTYTPATAHTPATTHIPAAARTANLGTIGWGETDNIAIHNLGNETYAFAVNWRDSGVQIMDITNPADPLPVVTISDDDGDFTMLGGALDIAVHDIGNRTYALVASFDDSGVQVIDITNPADPRPVAAVSDDAGGFTELGGAGGIAVHGADSETYALVASFDDSGVQIIDITYPADPRPVAAVSDDAGGFTELGGAGNIAVHGIGSRTYAVVTAIKDDGVQIMDITNAADPRPVAAVSDDAGGFTELGGAFDVAVHDIGNRTYAFVASRDDSGVQIMDITNPADPRPVAAVSDDAGGFTELGGAVNIAVHDTDNRTYAIVAGYKSVQIIDITNPVDPISVAWLEGAQSVAIHSISSKTYAMVGYTGSFGGGVQIIDMMNLESARLTP